MDWRVRGPGFNSRLCQNFSVYLNEELNQNQEQQEQEQQEEQLK